MADDEEFDNAASGASETVPKQCSALRKNEYVVIKGRPCKIVDMSTSKTGKHGHAKVHIVALDIFTGKKFEDICPSTHNMSVPTVTRKEYTFVDLKDGYLSLMDDMGDIREDLKLPDGEIGQSIAAKAKASNEENDESSFGVTVLKAMGEETVISCKMNTS